MKGITPANPPRASMRRGLILGMVALISAGGWFCYLEYTRRPRAFVCQWNEQFRKIDNLASARKFQEDNGVFLREFPSGEWLIGTCEHSCCSGAGFDATVIRDSKGAVFADTSHTFCGIEAMYSELGGIPADNLAGFYGKQKLLDLHRQ